MFWSFCQGVLCLIEAFYLWWMFRISAQEKSSKSYLGIIGAAVCFYLIADFAQIHAFVLNFLVCILMGGLFKCSISKKVVVCLLYVLFMDISEVLIMGIMNFIPDFDWNTLINTVWFNALGGLLSKLIAPIFILCYKHIVTTKDDVGFSKFQGIISVILIVMLAFVEIMCRAAIGFDSTPQFRMYFSMAAILILLAIGVIIYFFNQLINYYIQLCENKDIQHCMAITKQYYEMVEKNNEEISCIIHDYKNHIITAEELLKNNDTKAAADYLSQILENYKSEKLFQCDNKVASAVINQKLAAAKEKNIDFEIKPEASLENTIISDIDMCSLLSNLLDNAIEAAAQSENKKSISLKIAEKGSYLYVKCRNTYGHKPIIKDNRFITTKFNKKRHGMGIKIIKDIAKKYNGEFDYSVTDDWVTVSVLLNICEV